MIDYQVVKSWSFSGVYPWNFDYETTRSFKNIHGNEIFANPEIRGTFERFPETRNIFDRLFISPIEKRGLRFTIEKFNQLAYILKWLYHPVIYEAVWLMLTLAMCF